MKRVRFVNKKDQLIVSKAEISQYFEFPDELLVNMFLPEHYSYTLVDESEHADICIVGIQHVDNTLLRDNEINIFLSVENLKVGRTHYKHFNMFGRDGNKKINYYLYNDICCLENDAYPVVHHRIRHFLKHSSTLSIPPVLFEHKKFCLFTSRNLLNDNKHRTIQQLSTVGEIHTIGQYNIGIHTCYHSEAILHVFSRYKFIICFENSKTDGYVTEKIFNVFLSKSIPIYDGPPNAHEILNPDSFIQYDNKGHFIEKVKLLQNSETEYEKFVSHSKNQSYDKSNILTF
jgi:hypothetical protein